MYPDESTLSRGCWSVWLAVRAVRPTDTSISRVIVYAKWYSLAEFSSSVWCWCWCWEINQLLHGWLGPDLSRQVVLCFHSGLYYFEAAAMATAWPSQLTRPSYYVSHPGGFDSSWNDPTLAAASTHTYGGQPLQSLISDHPTGWRSTGASRPCVFAPARKRGSREGAEPLCVHVPSSTCRVNRRRGRLALAISWLFCPADPGDMCGASRSERRGNAGQLGRRCPGRFVLQHDLDALCGR
jgi:hypothetical protein